MKDNFWKDYHLPFRADFTIFDEYVYEEEEPLDLMITAFLSNKEPRITKALMDPWSEQTKYKDDFGLKRFPGDHFYVQDRASVSKVVDEVCALLEKVKSDEIPPKKNFVNDDLVRKINLLDILEEDYPEIEPPPEDCVGKCTSQKNLWRNLYTKVYLCLLEKWTEQEIRSYFMGKSAA